MVGAEIAVLDAQGVKLGDTRSSSGGSWRIDGLPEGDITIEATPPDTLSAVLAPVSVSSDVLRGQTTKEVQLRFERR